MLSLSPSYRLHSYNCNHGFSVPPVLPRVVKDVGVVRPSSPPSGCISPCSVEGNGFSQSRNWPVGFDHNGEIVVWEEEEDDY
jgi:hypothetical protein